MTYFTFSLDDGYQSWPNAAKMLSDNGWHGTFNVSLRNVVSERRFDRVKMFPPENVLTWGEVKEIQDMGHEIAAHGVRHIDLSECTNEELQLEVVTPKGVFASRNVMVTSYACAFNCWSKRVQDIGIQHYKAIRGVAGMDNLPPYNSPIYHTHGWNIALDKIRKEKGNIWICGAWHDDLANFGDAIKQVKRSGATVRSVEEMFNET